MKMNGRLRGTTVYLVRHGQSEWNGQKRVSGQLDPPLSLIGIRQSYALAEVLRNKSLDAIYTSTLDRAIHTAIPTARAHGLPIQTKEALKEIDFGILQGRYRDCRDLEAQRLWAEREKDPAHFQIPGGETFSALMLRVLPCLRDILNEHEGEKILLVGHRSTNRVLLGTLMGWPQGEWCMLDLRAKYLYEVFLQNGMPVNIATIPIASPHYGKQYAQFKM